MSNPSDKAAVVAIGDEILSGRTLNTNTQTIAVFLGLLGVQLGEARTIPDDHDVIAATVRELSGRYRYVFTTGGIGPTHDDITADAVAAAFGRPIGVRDDARDLLAAYYAARGTEFTPARQRMARIPDGAVLLDNPVSGAPGFVLENVFVMAGVPRIMAAMLESAAPMIRRGTPVISRALRADSLREGDVGDALRALAGAHPDVAIGSYPGGLESSGPYVTLVVRGVDAAAVEAAVRAVDALCRGLGVAPVALD